jgi:hypothetical protein
MICLKIKVMSQYYYYSKVLAQLSAIFYCAGCPYDNYTISNIMYNRGDEGHKFYNKNYSVELDALEAYNDYTRKNTRIKVESFKEMLQGW